MTHENLKRMLPEFQTFEESEERRRHVQQLADATRRDALFAALRQNNQDMKAEQNRIARETMGYREQKLESLAGIHEQHEQMVGLRLHEAQLDPMSDLPEIEPPLTDRPGPILSPCMPMR